MVKHEIVCIKRHGTSLLVSEGADFAAKVTYQKYSAGEVFDPRENVLQEILIPLSPSHREWYA